MPTARGSKKHGKPASADTEPVVVGGVGTASAPTAVDEGDVVQASFDLEGKLRTTATVEAGASAGDVAHDAADSGNPVKIGGKASASAPTAVDEGDRVNASFDLQGQLRTVGGAGGTQYTEADTDASITGTAVMWEDAADTLRAVSAAKPLPVAEQGTVTVDGSAVTQPVSGTFWQTTQPVSGTVSIQEPLSIDDNGSSITVDQGTPASLKVEIHGDVAYDSPESGNAVAVGGLATSALPGSVGENDRSLISTDLEGCVRIAVGDFGHDDFDTGGGNDYGVAVGVAIQGAGGHTLAGDSTNPFRVDPTGGTPQPVTGTFWQSTQPVSDDGGSLTVDGTFWQTTQPVSVAAVVSVDDNAGSLTVDDGGTTISIDDGAGSITVDGTVGVSGTVTVDGSGVTQPVSGTVTASNAAGNVAHDAADSGNPVKLGHKAVNFGATPTAVAAADRSDWYTTRAGVPFTLNGHPNTKTFRANYTAAQTNAAVITVSGGTKIVVMGASATLDNATTVDVQVRMGFGAATTPTGDGVFLTHPGLAAGSGLVVGGTGAVIGVGADGEDIRVTCEVPTTGSIDVTVTYFEIAG